MKSFIKPRFIGVFSIRNKDTDTYLVGKSYHCQEDVRLIVQACNKREYKNKRFLIDFVKHGKGKFEANIIEYLITYTKEEEETFPFKDYEYHLNKLYTKHLNKLRRDGKTLYNVDKSNKGVVCLSITGELTAEFKTAIEAAKYLKISRVTLGRALKLNKRNIGRSYNGEYPMFIKDYEENKTNLKFNL